jgi:hypothetical protein
VLGFVAVYSVHTEFGENLSCDSEVDIGARWYHGDVTLFFLPIKEGKWANKCKTISVD